MNWMSNGMLLIFTNAIAGTIAYGCWKLFALAMKKAGMYMAGRRLFCVMLFFWLIPANYILMAMRYYKKDGAWYGLPYHADVFWPLLNGLACLWLAGMFINICQILFALYHLKALPLSRQRSSVSAAGKMAKSMAFDAWARDDHGNLQLYPGFNWSEDISVYCAPVPVPAACPGLRTKILLPPSSYEPEELQMVVAHEVSHILRGDLKVRCCLLLLRTIFWFHPLVYRMFDDFEYWSEISCDIDVCYGGRIAVEPKKYLALLLSISESSARIFNDRIYARKYFMSDLSPDARRLKQRFQEILGYKQRKLDKTMNAVLTILFISVGVIVTLLAGGFAERAVARGIDTEHMMSLEITDESPFLVTNYVSDGVIRSWSLECVPENENTFYRYYEYTKDYDKTDGIYWFMGNVGAKNGGCVQYVYFTAGQTVTLYTEPSLRQDGVIAGFIYPDGCLHYICLEEAVYGSFEIQESGIYQLYVENTSEQPIVIGGSVMYNVGK